MDGETLGTTAQGAAAGSTFGPWGAAIGAGVGLLQGLLSQGARRDEEKRRAKAQAEQMGFQSQINAAKAMTEGEQNAFHQLMQGYQSSLIRG